MSYKIGASCDLNNNYETVNTQIELKKYNESSRLYFSNEIASDIINKSFKKNIDVYLKESLINVKAKLILSCTFPENFLYL